jgi:hypothetical protein
MKTQKRLQFDVSRPSGQTRKTRSLAGSGLTSASDPLSRTRFTGSSSVWLLVATGHDREVLHVFFKRRAFGVRVESVGAEEVEYVPSSAKASRGDFSELIEHVQAFIAEHGIEESA